MKKKMKVMSLVLLFVFVLSLIACQNETTTVSVWEEATYTEDMTIGEGKKVFDFVVEAEDKSVVFTIKTDAEFLGEALQEHKLVSGEEGSYGLYIKYVNGILADYDKNGAYWGFYQDGEYMNVGADETVIQSGAEYKVVYEKQ